MMFDYNFTPETLYEEARKVELEAAQLYLNACEAMATACTATAPYLIKVYNTAERNLRRRYSRLMTLVLRAEDKRALNTLLSVKLYLDIVRERLLP